MDDVRYVSAKEAADRLGISLRTVRRRIADGSLPSLKLGGAVRIPASALERPSPGAGRHIAPEAAARYATEDEDRAAYIHRWNREHWPDTFERMLERRREAFAELARLRQLSRPPSGPHDTADALLNRVRDEFGARLLQFIPERPEPKE